MSSQRETSLQWGAGIGFIGFIGVVMFIFNVNAGTHLVPALQMFFGKQLTLDFLQFMSVLTVVCGIALLVHGIRSPE